MKDIAYKREVNRCLNFVKGMAAILIIVLHGEFPTYIGSAINMLARLGVPVFFMTSGYYLYKEDGTTYSDEKFRKKILKTLKLVIIYFGINIIYDIVRDTLLYDFSSAIKNMSDLVNVKNIIDTVLFNRTIIGVGGWFLTAMLLAYIILYFVNKKGIYDKMYYMIIPLLTIQFLLAYVPHFFGRGIAVWYYRNIWFLALPCMLIGHYTHKNKEKIRKIYPDKELTVLLLLVLGIAVSAAERAFIGGFSIYVGTIFLALLAFLYAIKNPEKYYISAVENIGANITFHMFIIHPFVIENTKRLAKYIGVFDNLGIQFMLPILNILITIIVSWCVFGIVKGAKK